MPNDFLVKEAQAYKEQPIIQIGYNANRGGLGTVTAMVIEQPIEIAQASNSMKKRKRLER
jgi:ABC-type phosphate transport system substrate-binding protein